MRAFILLKVNPNDTPHLMQEFKEAAYIQQADFIHGPFDCLLEVEAKSLDEINKAVLDLRARKGIVETLTCLVIQSWQR
jgi:DNA-binding Lrp family transcriptional regulator